MMLIFRGYEGYRDGNLQTIITDCQEPYSAGYENEEEYNKMKESVLQYNGFYVGRYEAGTTASTGTGIRGDLVVKQRANVYNFIKWGNSMTNDSGGVVEVAKGMYSKEERDSVTSTLIYGVQ